MVLRFPVLSCFLLLFFPLSDIKAQQDFASYVNPFIGTGGHGHTFPGATAPFGMVQLSPDTRIDGSWDGCGGYHYSDSVIYGFSHTHLSGTGVSDYGDIMLMPARAKTSLNPVDFASTFSHAKEKATAGYYSVFLNKPAVKAELSATARAGFHRYTFEKGSPRWILLDLNHRDKLTEGVIKRVGDRALQGFRRSEAWARDQVVYFYMEFSEPFENLEIIDRQIEAGRYGADVEKAAWLNFKKSKKPLLVKVGISAGDKEGARNNLLKEIAHWDFEKTKAETYTAWNNELDKIRIGGGTSDQLAIFYTALYHCMVAPNIFNDADGRYRGHDFKVHTTDHNVYTVFSLWDTFRALHPLLTLIDEKRTADFIKSFLLNYQQGGRLPVWELAANETDCMIGYHAVPVIADAMVKGVFNFNDSLAYEAMKYSANLDHLGLKAYKEKGYIEIEDEPESVSKTLEYAYDDWCIAQVALIKRRMNDYWYFKKRSFSWLNLLDPATGHMRPRSNGGWLTLFEPREVNNHFTEGNSWQYTFFAPHHISYLAKAQGGGLKFGKKLDALFSAPIQTTGREQADITGLIGQYAHGNEPSHHMAYLYDYIRQPHKTQEYVSRIMHDFYKNTPDGLIGNEDCGQMSAWYVFSAMGFYPVCPGSTMYALGTPLFDKIVLNTGRDSLFTIETRRKSPTDIYIADATLDGVPLSMQFIQHMDFSQSRKLAFDMSGKPQKALGKAAEETEEEEAGFYPAPAIAVQKTVFNDSVKIEAKAPVSFYLAINEQPLKFVQSRDTTFYVYATSAITVTNSRPDSAALSARAMVYKKNNNWSVQISSRYNPQYTAGGDEGLIDGLHGDANWRKGRWQGYQGQDFEAIIDLKQVLEVNEMGGSFLQDTRSWILMPVSVSFETSFDGVNWRNEGLVQNTLPDNDYTSQTRDFILKQYAKARYIKVKAKNYGALPPWHQGAGNPAFIFTDEVWVR